MDRICRISEKNNLIRSEKRALTRIDRVIQGDREKIMLSDPGNRIVSFCRGLFLSENRTLQNIVPVAKKLALHHWLATSLGAPVPDLQSAYGGIGIFSNIYIFMLGGTSPRAGMKKLLRKRIIFTSLIFFHGRKDHCFILRYLTSLQKMYFFRSSL